MKPRTLVSAVVVASCAGFAPLPAVAGPEVPSRSSGSIATPEAGRSSRLTFSLLPKSFQRRPWLDFHVITELTNEGRKLAPPTAAEPVHYIAQPGTFNQMGNNVTNERPPDVEQLTRAMEAALATSHYLKASPSTPLPAIAVVFNYGSFARFSMEFHDQQEDQNLAQLAHQIEAEGGDGWMIYSGPMARSEERSIEALLPIVLSHQRERDDVLQRATLIGGEKFSRDLAQALNDEARHRSGRDTSLSLGGIDRTGPFHRFMNANANLLMLVEDSFNGCYFVVASAYDYIAMREGKRVLLWRTKMTVNSSGINMSESLPALVRTAGPYLGKEMAEAVTVAKRIDRLGKVEFGPLQIISWEEPEPDPKLESSRRSSQPAQHDAKPVAPDGR